MAGTSSAAELAAALAPLLPPQLTDNEKILKDVRDKKLLDKFFKLTNTNWDEWVMKLRAGLIPSRSDACLLPDNPDGTAQLTPEIQRVVKAQVAAFLSSDDAHIMMNDNLSLWKALEEIKKSKTGSDMHVIQQCSTKISMLQWKPK